MRQLHLAVVLAVISLLLDGCGEPPVDKAVDLAVDQAWRADDATLAKRVETLAAAREIDAAEGVFATLVGRTAAGSVPEQRARLALARALVGLDRGPDAAQHLGHLVWADKDPRIASEVLALQATVQWRTLCRDGVPISGALPAFAAFDAPLGKPAGAWQARREAYAQLAIVLDQGVRLVRAEGGTVALPVTPEWLALARYAHGDRTPAELAAELGAIGTWSPALALAVVRVHLAEYSPEDAVAAAAFLFEKYPKSAEADAAFTQLAVWQLRCQRVAATMPLWSSAAVAQLLTIEKSRRAAAAAEAQKIVAADHDLNAMAVTSAVIKMAMEAQVAMESDVEGPGDVEPVADITSTQHTSVDWKMATAWQGLSVNVPSDHNAGTPVPVTIASEHRGAHEVSLYQFNDVAAWKICAHTPSREALPSTVLSHQSVEVGPWATLGQTATMNFELPNLAPGFYAIAVTARGCPVVLVRGFCVNDADLQVWAADDGVLAWVVTRDIGQSRPNESLTATFELIRDPAKAGGKPWKIEDDTWCMGFRIAFLGSPEEQQKAAWQASMPAYVAGFTAGSAAAKADPAQLITLTAITGADGVARIPLPAGMRGRAWHARVALTRTDVAIAAQCDHGEVAAATTEWLAWADKPACRPGERLHFKVLLREWSGERWARPTGAMPITITVGGRDLQTTALPISEMGTISGEVAIPAEAPVGRIDITCAGSHRELSTIIEARLPSAMLTVDAGPERIPAGAARTVSGTVRGAEGQALPGVDVSLEANALALDGKRDPSPDRHQATTDASGHFSVVLPTPRERDLQWRVQVVGRVGNESVAQVVTWASIDFPVPLEAMMLERFLTVGDVARVRLNLPMGAQVWLSGVTNENAIVGERSIVTGTGNWQEIAIVAAANMRAVRITARRADGSEAEHRLTCTVAPRPVTNDQTITCEPETSRVLPDAQLQVVIGCTASARDVLVLGASANIQVAQMVQLTEPAQRIQMQVTDAWAPDVVLAAIVWIPGRGFVASPQRTVSVLPVDRLLTVTSAAIEDDLRPGTETQIRMHAKNWKGKPMAGVALSVGVVDERLYALHEDETPDLQTWFNRVHRSWSVITGTPENLPQLRGDLWRSVAWCWQSNVVDEMFGNRSGGGRSRSFGCCGASRGSESAALVVLPEADSTIFWNADVRTDAEGNALVTLRLPDHAGRYRITARANDASAAVMVGSARGVLAIREPVSCMVVSPEAVRPGDAFEMTCELTSSFSAPITTQVEVTLGTEVVGTRQITVLPGRRTQLAMPVRVLIGTGPLRRVGEMLGQATTLKATVTVPGQRPVVATRDLLVLAAGSSQRHNLQLVGEGHEVPLAAAGSAVWLRVRAWPDAATRRTDELKNWLTSRDERGLYAWLMADDSTQRSTELSQRWQASHSDAWKFLRILAARRAGQPADELDLPDGALGIWLAAGGTDVGLLPRSTSGLDRLPTIATDLRLGTSGAGRRWLGLREQVTLKTPLLSLVFALDAARSAGDEVWSKRITSWIAQADWSVPLDAVLAADALSSEPMNPVHDVNASAGTLIWGTQRVNLPAGIWTTWSQVVDAPLRIDLPQGSLLSAEVIEQTADPLIKAETRLLENSIAVPATALVIETPGVLRLHRPLSGWPQRLLLPSLVRGRAGDATMQFEQNLESTWELPPAEKDEVPAQRFARMSGVTTPNAQAEIVLVASNGVVTFSLDARETGPQTVVIPVDPIAIGTCTWAGGLLTVAADLPPPPPPATFPLLDQATARLAAATPIELVALLSQPAQSIEEWSDLFIALNPAVAHTRAQLLLHPACGLRDHWSTKALESWIKTDIDPDIVSHCWYSFDQALDEILAARALRQEMIDKLPFPQAVMPKPGSVRACLDSAAAAENLPCYGGLTFDGITFDDWLWQQPLSNERLTHLGYATDVDGWVACMATEFGINVRIGSGIAPGDGEAGGDHLGVRGFALWGIALRTSAAGLELVREPGHREPVLLSLSVEDRPLAAVLADLNPDRERRGLPPVTCESSLADLPVSLNVRRLEARLVITWLAKVAGGQVSNSPQGVRIVAGGK